MDMGRHVTSPHLRPDRSALSRFQQRVCSSALAMICKTVPLGSTVYFQHIAFVLALHGACKAGRIADITRAWSESSLHRIYVFDDPVGTCKI